MPRLGSLLALLAWLLMTAPAVAQVPARTVAATTPGQGVRYLVDGDDLPRLAKEFGLDEEAAERLATAHQRLVEHQSHPKPDPVKTNGPVFLDEATGKPWPKPVAALVFTGEQDGYLEPCGCAGLENQKGGLKRRHTMIRTLRDDWGWPLVAMDAGEQVKHFGPQAQIKFRQSIESLIEIGYQAVGFGVRDLRTDVLGLAINLDEATNPLTSANVALMDFDSGLTKRFRVITVGEGAAAVRIGVTSVTGDAALAELGPSDDLLTLPASQALAEVLPELVAAKCDQNVLLVYGDRAEAEALARKHDVFDWVVAARGSDEPPSEAMVVEGTKRGGGTALVEVGHKGQYAVVVGLYRKPGATPKPGSGEGWLARYQRTPLDHRWADSPEMQKRLVDYQDELRTLGWEGLNVRPQLHPTAEDFAGSAACADCHTSAWEVFVNTPHFSTTETLVALSPARHFDPECISCHSTGWEPQKYFPFKSGWLSYEETPAMFGQGCENCHGPAARHAAVENGDLEVSEAEQTSLRQALHMDVVENEGNMPGQALGKAVNNCLQCHDLDNSPDFDFQEYWPQVAHEGMD